MKDNKHKRLYSVYFQLYGILEKPTIIIESLQVFSRNKGRAGNWGEKSPCDNLWGDGNFLKLDSGGSCPTNEFY